MKLSKNNQKIIDTLKKHKLTYLVTPFKKMVELDKLKEIKIHRMEWKHILKEIYNEKNTKFDIEKLITHYFSIHKIQYENKEVLDHSKSKDRVSKYREDKKTLGYKTISVQLSPVDFANLAKYKKDFNFTYSQAIHYLLELYYPEEFENDFFD